MEHWAPLIQTVLWVGLISAILWFFYEPIYGLLTAIQKRVEGGSNIKAGPFEISELKPQDPSKQKEKAQLEVTEALQEEPAMGGENQPVPVQRASIQAQYFQAEDLVLRAIQAEFGVTISRQVTAGADMGFDGAFVVNERFNVVEVKFVGRSISQSKVEVDLDRLIGTISQYGWRNVQIILAIVFANPESLSKGAEWLKRIHKRGSVPIVVRTYLLAHLQAQFGIEPTEDG